MGAGHGIRCYVKETLHGWFPSIPGPTEGDYIGSCKNCFKPGHHCNGICPGNAYYAPGQPGNLDGKLPRVELPKKYKLPPEFAGWTTPCTHQMYWQPVNYGAEQWYYHYSDNRYVDIGPSAVAHWLAPLPPAGSPGSAAGSSVDAPGSRLSGGSAASGATGSRRSTRDRPSYRDREDRGAGSSGGSGRSQGGSEYGSIRSGGISAD